MFVWVYVFLSPGITYTCSLAQACWSKTWAAWHDVCAFAEKKHLGSRHRQIRSDSKIKASQLQSPRFPAESSHKIISGVLECYGKQWESPTPKECAGISTYILHVKSKRTQKSSSLSVYSGKVSDFYLAAVLLGISTMQGVSYRCAAECRDVVFFFQVGEAPGRTWRCSEPRVTQRFLRVKSDLKLANVPPETSTQGLLR